MSLLELKSNMRTIFRFLRLFFVCHITLSLDLLPTVFTFIEHPSYHPITQPPYLSTACLPHWPTPASILPCPARCPASSSVGTFFTCLLATDKTLVALVLPSSHPAHTATLTHHVARHTTHPRHSLLIPCSPLTYPTHSTHLPSVIHLHSH